ncbi:GNAT family N-acetyltransferase [soil metagenome]
MTIPSAPIEFTEVAADDPTFEISDRILTTVALHDRPTTARPMTLEDSRASFADQPASGRIRRWLVRDRGVAVAVTELWLPMLDNLALGFIEVAVLPEHRRRGIGTAALTHLESVMAEVGRNLMSTAVIWGADQETSPGFEFAKARGFTARNRELHRRLALPVDRGLLLGLAATAADKHQDYQIVTFTGSVPEEILVSFAALDALVDSEAPTGELEMEPDTPDPDGIRHSERLWAGQKRAMWGAVALTSTGEVVAMTQMIQRSGAPDSIAQSGTIVRRDHRGHRLGLAVKTANLLQIRDGFTEVTTWNAASNDHMVAVNDLLGFTVIEQAEAVQKRLP